MEDCNKRIDCGRLIIIARPTCEGKPTLIDGLYWGNHALLSKALEIKHPIKWKPIPAIDMEMYRASVIDRIILHYDIVYRLRSIRNYTEDSALAVIETSKKVKIITLWATPELLISRFKARRSFLIHEGLLSISLLKVYGAWKRWLNISRLLYKLHNDSDYLVSVYNNWFDLCTKIEADSQPFINCSEIKPDLHPLSNWYSLKASRR